MLKIQKLSETNEKGSMIEEDEKNGARKKQS